MWTSCVSSWRRCDGEQAIATRTLKRWLLDDNNTSQPSAEQIHVLVAVSEDYVFLRIKEVENDAKYKDELTHYQRREELIQRNCEDYCQQILSKIDALYALSDEFSLPFICVEESSGMGKSQLAFAWEEAARGFTCMKIFRQFSKAFRGVTNKDGPMTKSEEDILN